MVIVLADTPKWCVEVAIDPNQWILPIGGNFYKLREAETNIDRWWLNAFILCARVGIRRKNENRRPRKKRDTTTIDITKV